MFYMVKKSIFLEILGDYPINRVLDFLIIFDQFDYSMKDIARNAGVGYTTLKSFWPDLVKKKIVVLSRKVGKAKLYKLNRNNVAVKHFVKMYWSLTKQQTDKFLKKDKKENTVKISK